jgi:hypothetical protein
VISGDDISALEGIEMKDDVTQSDGFADGMLVVSAAAYPVIRGAASAVGGAIDHAQRQTLISRGASLTRAATELVAIVRSELEAIHRTLQRLDLQDMERYVPVAVVNLEDRARWFSPQRIREFVEANEVDPLLLCNELGEFLVAPVREAVDAMRQGVVSGGAAGLETQLRELELTLIRFIADRFGADISRPHEPNHLVRSWFGKAARIGAILAIGIAALLAIVLLSLR